MSLDSDVALLGTGLAPLVAANQLASQGYRVLLINPDADFFLENSELSFDPLWPLDKMVFSSKRLKQNTPEAVLDVLRPGFPGAVEYWAEKGNVSGFHDVRAPHVRQRSRLWVLGPKPDPEQWEFFENLFVEGEDWGLNPQILDGLQSVTRFPGIAPGVHGEHYRGILFPRFCDFDVTSYRNGLLEFVRERLGPQRVVCGAGQVELMPGGLRFNHGGKFRTVRIEEGVLAFWTPRLSQWVSQQAKQREVKLAPPRGIRLWEEWSLFSRDPLDVRVLGALGNIAVLAECEGAPASEGANRMSVLVAGALAELDSGASPARGLGWAGEESFSSLTRLCCDFLNWDRYSVRSMRPRALLEWIGEPPDTFLPGDPGVTVVGGSDGSMVDVVRRAREACERLVGVEE